MHENIENKEAGDYNEGHCFSATVNDSKNRVEVHIKGPIQSVSATTRLVMRLNELSQLYPVCMVYINSIGGSAHLMVELMGAFKKFQNLITVATGCAASAGFLLWAIGDIRVVDKYTGLMAHRERYSVWGVTRHHKQTADFSEELYGKMSCDICEPLLTAEEFKRMDFEDINMTGEEMISRGHAISADDFTDMDMDGVVQLDVINIGEKSFIRDIANGTVTEILDMSVGATYDEFLMRYGISDIMVPAETTDKLEEINESDSTTERQGETE